MLVGIGRTVLFYVLLLVSMRLLGKRQLGDLELSELVVLGAVIILRALLSLLIHFEMKHH